MSKQSSIECVSSGLDIFKTKPMQTSVENGFYVEVRPLASITEGSPIEFVIKGSPECYIDLANTYLNVQAQILREDGTVLNGKDNECVIFEQLAIHSLFSEVDCLLNSTIISTSSNSSYAYRSYIETLLNYDKATKTSQLELSMFYPHTTGDFTFDKNSKSPTIELRRKRIKDSRVCDMIGKLHLDLSYSDIYMLNGVDIRLRFVRAKDKFVLNAYTVDDAVPIHPYKVKILHAGLFVKKLKINPQISLSHARVLNNGGLAKYHIKRSVLKTFSAATGSMNINLDSTFANQIPSRVVVGICDSDAFNGTYSKSAYEFKHYDISSLAFFVDSVQVPTKSFSPNFSQKKYARSYFSLYSGTNTQFDNLGPGITYDDYADGMALWVMDLTPTPTDDECVELYKHGSLSLSITLAQALPVPVNIILYSIFDSCIQIDKARNILLDW